ncbi:MAG: amidohydrolase family protein [Desulfurococcaceae archaeon]
MGNLREKIDVLVNNGLIVTSDARRSVVAGGYVAIRGNTIVDVGKGDGTTKYAAEEIIDARKGVVTPGLMNAHTHFYGALLRASPWFAKIEPPTDFQQNLQRIWWAMDVLLGHDEAYAAGLIGALMYVRSGVTNFFDNISSPNTIDGVLDDIERGVNEVGIRGILSFEATQRRSLEEGYRGLAENERFIKKNNYDESRLVKGAIYLHASFTVTDELFVKAKELARKHGALVAIHTEEGMIDVMHDIEWYGERPVERMKRLGFLDDRTILVHVVNATQDELEIVRQTGAHVAHNPLSNMLNAVGVANVPLMLKLGINVGIGDDGYIFDIFENMRGAYLLHKVWNRDPRLMDPATVFDMVTRNVARMFGVERSLGSIEPGKKADVVVIKPRRVPTPVNEQTVYGHLVNSFSGNDVDTVIVDGRIVMRDGKVLTLDEERAVERVHKIVERFWDKLLAEGKYQLDVLKHR